jgi:hypothetical protein
MRGKTLPMIGKTQAILSNTQATLSNTQAILSNQVGTVKWGTLRVIGGHLKSLPVIWGKLGTADFTVVSRLCQASRRLVSAAQG